MTDFLRNLETIVRARFADPEARIRAEWQLLHLSHVSDKPIRTEALQILSGVGKTYVPDGACPCPNCKAVRKTDTANHVVIPAESAGNVKRLLEPIKPAKPTGYQAAKKSYVYSENEQ